MTNITREQIAKARIEKIYPIVVDVYKGRMTLKDGRDYLVEEVGMNKRTARNYIEFFVKLKEGKLYESTEGPNNPATNYFFKKILDEDDEDDLRNALISLCECIEYTEPRRDYELVEFRRIHKEFSAKLSNPPRPPVPYPSSKK